ncbi:MAG: hypothetical protein U1D30_09780 [Planctomycetota bacterium]
MSTLTKEDLKDLMEQSKGQGLLLSCFVDLSEIEGFRSHGLAHFKAEASSVRRMLPEFSAEREEADRNLEAIGRILETVSADHAKGLAVFMAKQRNFERLFLVDGPLENRLVIHRDPYLVPLLFALNEQREYLAVVCDTHQARLYDTTSSNAHLVRELSEEVPKKQHSSGERWGKEQATIARHRENVILHFHKDVAAAVEKAWSDHPYFGIILLGEHEILAHLRDKLPRRLQEKIVHEAAWTFDASECELLAAVEELDVQISRAKEMRMVGEVNRREKEGRAVARGPKEVLDALQSGRIGASGHGCLLVGSDPGELVGRCMECGHLDFEVPTHCSRCRAVCESVNLWEEVLLFALRHRIEVCPLHRGSVPEWEGWMAALLQE